MTARRPLFVAVNELMRHPGTRRSVTRSVLLDGLAISSATVPVDERIEIDVTIESMGAEVVAAGTVTAPYVGECRRCLDAVAGTVTSTVREIFERHPTDGETYLLEGDHVDLEQMVRDAVLLALPLAPLCGDDCRGPAPEVFPTVVGGEIEPAAPTPTGTGMIFGDDRDGVDGDGVEGDGGGGDDVERVNQDTPRDQRWAALDQLRLEE